jgi:hypothetical protein
MAPAWHVMTAGWLVSGVVSGVSACQRLDGLLPPMLQHPPASHASTTPMPPRLNHELAMPL